MNLSGYVAVSKRMKRAASVSAARYPFSVSASFSSGCKLTAILILNLPSDCVY